MTFLELVQEFHRVAGAAGREPSSVTTATGEAARFVLWIKRADEYVQLKYVNWKFLRQAYSVAATPSTATMTKPALLRYWDFKTFFYKEVGGTERYPFQAVEYDKVKGDVLDDSESDTPWRAIVMPNNDLQLEPVPSAAYTVEADYYEKPTLLAANTDVSLIPEEFHQIIIGRALILYGNFENAPEQVEQGKEIYIEQLALLENDQLPNQEHSRFNTGAMIEVIAG